MAYKFHAICASSFIPYTHDAGTARCRITIPMFGRLGLKMGWIVQLKLRHPTSGVTASILCTAWPDTANALESDNFMIVDDCISKDADRYFWTDAECEVSITNKNHFSIQFSL